MKIIHVITGLSTGGAERALYKLLTSSHDKQHNLAVISLSDKGTYGPIIRALDIPVYSLGIKYGLPRPIAILRMKGIVKEFRPDIIQGWMYHGNLAATLAGWLAPGNPAVAWNVRHSLYSLAGEKPLTRQVIRANKHLSSRVDAIVYNSSISRRQHEEFGFSKSKGHVISNGFDVKVLKPSSASREATLSAISIPNNAQVIGHVARFHPIKDHANFLRAAVQVALQMPQARFMVVGREVNLGNPALAGIVPQDLVDRFCFLGERDDVSVLMQAMDVLCTSSLSEAFPNVLGEAMATGVPCVATDVGDSAIIIGDTGIVVPPSDSQALAQGLLKILSKTEEERYTLGCAARLRVIENYTLSKIDQEYNSLYTMLMKNEK